MNVSGGGSHLSVGPAARALPVTVALAFDVDDLLASDKITPV